MRDIPLAINPKSHRFIDQLRMFIRAQNLAYSTEKTYIGWILDFIRFQNLKHPNDMGREEIEQYLNFLSVQRHCTKSTQRTALNALVFVFSKFLKRGDLGRFDYISAKRPPKIPTVFSHHEALLVINHLEGKFKLMAQLMYGTGLRISELLRLRIKDIDFEMNNIVVRSGKGGKDRITLLPSVLKKTLKDQIDLVAALHKQDLNDGYGEVYLPNALAKKYPSAPRQLAWQFLFPSGSISEDPRSGIKRRHHLDQSVLAKKIRSAIRMSNIHKKASSHTFRHSFATRLLENNYCIRTVQELMGHSDVTTTEIYTHVTKQGKAGVKSPVDL